MDGSGKCADFSTISLKSSDGFGFTTTGVDVDADNGKDLDANTGKLVDDKKISFGFCFGAGDGELDDDRAGAGDGGELTFSNGLCVVRWLGGTYFNPVDLLE